MDLLTHVTSSYILLLNFDGDDIYEDEKKEKKMKKTKLF